MTSLMRRPYPSNFQNPPSPAGSMTQVENPFVGGFGGGGGGGVIPSLAGLGEQATQYADSTAQAAQRFSSGIQNTLGSGGALPQARPGGGGPGFGLSPEGLIQEPQIQDSIFEALQAMGGHQAIETAGQPGSYGPASDYTAGSMFNEGGPVMSDSVYNRRMFRMANGGMMPPMTAGPPMPPPMPPQGALPPELAAMMGGGGGGQQPVTDPSQLPPEVLQAADENLSAATNELLEEELAAASGEEAARSMANVAAAGDITGLLNAVWDDNRTLDEYRSDLAAVVGAEDAAQTPDSVLALVQPTLQLAQLDQGVGALMQEELAEMGTDPGGITGLAAKSAVADNMAAETGALVDAVGGMSGGQPPMMMEESVGIMAAAPGGMEDVTETMVTGPYA